MQLTRQLVEQDNVFAVVGSLGTEVNLAIRPYLNAKKVPQLLNATGATTWGARLEEVPVDDRLAARLRARGHDLRTGDRPQQPEREDRRPLPERRLRQGLSPGLEAGLGGKTSNIVGKESYEVTAPDVKSQIAKLKATGATVFVILATPQVHGPVVRDREGAGLVARRDLHELGVGHRHVPHARPEVRRGHLVNNTFTTQYAKDPANPKWDNDAAMKLYREVMAKYYPNGSSAAVQGNASTSTASLSPTRSCSSCSRQGRTRRVPGS